MPQVIIKRADQVLKQLEEDHSADINLSNVQPKTESGMQLSFFQLDDPVLSQVRDEILGADINNLTPVEALNKLNEIKKILTGKN